MVGVEDETAYTDTEGIEHHVHPSTILRIERLAEYLRKNQKHLKVIRDYIESR